MEVGEPVSVPLPAKTEEKDKPRIISVMIVHDASGATVGSGTQIVNLPKDAKWVGNGVWVKSQERLGTKLRIKVTFNQPGSHEFKLKLEADADNVQYTGGEKGRNANFKHQEAEKSYTTDGDGTKIVADDFFVTVAGGAFYRPVATDAEGNEVRGGLLYTQRLAYYVELKMKGLDSAETLSGFRQEFYRHHLNFDRLEPVEMDHMPNIGSSADTDAFKAKARAAYSGSAGPGKEPYVIAIAYTDHLAVKDANRKITKGGVETGPGKADVEVIIADTSKTPPENKVLWHDLVPGEGWFVSATFLPDGGTAGKDEVVIPQANCTPKSLSASNPNLWKKVKIKVSGMAEAKGTITLRVNWVNRMRGGISLGNGNIVCVCTRSWWKDKSTSDQNQVVIHEVGHQLRMVADGSGKNPDRVATQYTDKGHKGSHCHYNLPVKTSYSGVSGSSCVMFGATNGVSTFCPNCAPAVVKQDLSAGWTAF